MPICNTSKQEETIPVALESWDRFLTRDLTVEYSLLGDFHAFQYMGSTVRISLPSERHLDASENEDSRASIESCSVKDGVRTILGVHIHSVDVAVNRAHVVALRKEVLHRPPVALALIDGGTQEQLRAITAEANTIAAAAFAHWLSVMRWKCKQYAIGMFDVTDNKSGWSTYLLDVQSSARVWANGHTFIVKKSHAVTGAEWDSVRSTLLSGAEVPIHVQMLHSAQQNMNRMEYRQTIIELAIACEVFMRATVMRQVPESLSDSMRQMIEEANIHQYLKRFFPDVLSVHAQADFKKLRDSQLNKMFDVRNKIMHMAEETRATRENCRSFAKAVESLFSLELEAAATDGAKGAVPDELNPLAVPAS